MSYEREQAMLSYCQEIDSSITEHDIVSENYGCFTIGDTYNTPLGQFSILNDDEVKDAMTESIKNSFDELGLDAFSKSFQEYICQHYIDEGSKEQLIEDIREFATSYMEDIAYESGDETELTRQQEEIIEFLYQNGEIDFDVEDVKQYEEDKSYSTREEEITEFLENYDNKVEDYIDKYAEDYAEEYIDNPIEYYQEHFGNESVVGLVENGHITIDFDGIAEEIGQMYGRGNTLASYDGQEQEVTFDNVDYYVYCQDDRRIEKVIDMIAEMNLNDDDAELVMELLDDGIISREMLENKEYDAILENIVEKEEIDIAD